MKRTSKPFFRIGVCALSALLSIAAVRTIPSVESIVLNSTAASEKDWAAAPSFDYFETDRIGAETKTYEVMMIQGSPYRSLVSVNGVDLPPSGQKARQREVHQVAAARGRESASARAERIAKYKNDREREHIMMSQLSQAFEFKIHGRQTLNGHDTYVLDATPRAGYRPPNLESEALIGMMGPPLDRQKQLPMGQSGSAGSEAGKHRRVPGGS